MCVLAIMHPQACLLALFSFLHSHAVHIKIMVNFICWALWNIYTAVCLTCESKMCWETSIIPVTGKWGTITKKWNEKACCGSEEVSQGIKTLFSERGQALLDSS